MQDRSPQTLWETALGQLELQVTRPNFETWLRTTVGLRMEADLLTVGVPSDFTIEWLRSRMTSAINRTVSELLGRPVSVSFQVLGTQSPSSLSPSNGHQPPPTSASPPVDLNQRLTFTSFTVVESNRLAYRAARQATSGDVSYNPLVLYGGPGLGKTHLLHAIAHRALRAGRKVALLTAEAFVDRYTRAVEAGHRQTFRDTFLDCDLFLMDDLQFLATRPGSQDQFFHIFNTLHSAGRLLVLTTDLSPQALSDLTPRLRSRLLAGLTIELGLPPPNQCLEILRAKASLLRRPVPDSVLQLIVERPYHHVRDLEGALNRLDAYADLTGAPPSPDTLGEALYPLHSSNRPSPDAILRAVCKQLNLSLDHLSGPSRARDVTYARHVAMYLLRHLSHRPLAEIGKLLGGRDHSTVVSGSRRIKHELASLPQTRADIQQLTSALQNEPAA